MTNLLKITNLLKFMIKFQKQNLYKDVISKAISAFAQNIDSNLLAMAGRIDFIHAVLEVINNLDF